MYTRNLAQTGRRSISQSTIRCLSDLGGDNVKSRASRLEDFEDDYKSVTSKSKEVRILRQLLDQDPYQQENQEIEVPSKIPVRDSLEVKETYKNNFVDFNTNDILKVTLKQTLSEDYADFFSRKSFHQRDIADPSKSIVHLMLEYTSKQDAEFTIINEKYTFIKIELPASVKSHVIQNIESGNLNVSDLVATLDENAELQRYSKFNLLTSLLNLSDELTSNKDLFLKDLSIYINDHISSFSREEIETILYQYSSLDQPHLLNLAIANLNSMLAPNDVSLYVSYGLRLELFRFYIAEKDFQSAYHLLNSNAEHNLIPPASYIASYLSLLDTVANSLESSQKNKTMIFNAYSAPLSRVLRAHGGDYITPEMVSIVLRWMNSKEIVWFINYLKLCQAENFFTGFNSLMIDLYCVRLVEEYDLGAESNASPSEFGFESAGKLTSFINHLATSEFEPIDDSTIKTIINSYCKFGSSVAVRLWLGKLSEKLSAEDISTFTESLKSCQSQSPGNFPGFGKQALQSTIAYIEGLK